MEEKQPIDITDDDPPMPEVKVVDDTPKLPTVVDEDDEVKKAITQMELTASLVRKVKGDIEAIDLVKSKFKGMKKAAAIKLIEHLLYQKGDIRVKDINPSYTKFLNYNMGKFEYDNNKGDRLLKKDFQSDLHSELMVLVYKIHVKNITEYDKDTHKSIKYIKEDGGFVVSRNDSYDKFRTTVANEDGRGVFKYDFDNPDMMQKPPRNSRLLQRSYIQILSEGLKFGYPIEYQYRCPQCDTEFTFKAYIMASTGGKYKCTGYAEYTKADGTPGVKQCNMMLRPDDEVSPTCDAYYHEIGYTDENGKEHSSAAIAMECYKPGFYDSALYRINNPKKTELYNIVDVELIESESIVFPDMNPKENYLITLQKTFDAYIKDKTRMEIYALNPIKVSLIVQAAASYLGFDLKNNVQIMGDASSGKSTVLKYYGYLLYSYRHLSTNGQSISIPALRGTRESINLLGKDTKIVTIGHLGTFKSIHIDEISDNEELVKSMKTFLVESNYSYNKAGATLASRKRTAQVSISGNLDHTHVGQYRGSIKKAYREYTSKIGNYDKPDFDDSWDLHQPLYKYADNPYLMKIIMDKRNELYHKRVWWIDGFETALHERFPLYFYLLMDNITEDFKKVIRDNVARKPISENSEIMRVLRNNNLVEFFESFIPYIESPHDSDSFIKVDEILDSYNIHSDSRMKEFYYNFVKISRIMNKRLTFTDIDYDLLRWIIEKTNCKINFNDTIGYEIQGPPNIEELKEKTKEIEESITEEDVFGLPGDLS